ncbi:hypothetical protein [Altererythrobacter sp. ZODW24]|uniref:hypothetical protein n=1 Tax=Altererythrobacter sp. ZODW24 TaxID=2185142 RepID=UPI000DF78D76|nr:hypothetical protein [Altererythrobacter sp. ZODW24]
MGTAILRSSLDTSLLRYRRSKALWLMLLSAPIAARYMISQEEGQGISVTIGNQLPVLTSAVLGVWLGIVVSTLVMPIAYIYLRANTTRRQPWQVEEVTAASRVSIALGRFLADCAILLAVLAMLSFAGLFLGWLMVTGPWNPLHIVGLLWLVAAPTFVVVAAIRILFDAVPMLRGAFGDVLFFIIWMAALVAPSIMSQGPATFGTSMADLGGALTPLVQGAPEGSNAFAIGASSIVPGRMELDVFKGIAAEGYIASRLIWIGIAFAVAALAGLLYRPHRSKARKQRFKWLGKLSLAKLLPAAQPLDSAAPRAAIPLLGLLLTEMRLIASGPLFPLLAVAAALAGLAPDFRHIGSPAGLLLLVFALSAHAGRTEARGLVSLTETTATPSWLRRAVFVAAGTILSVLMALPAIVVSASIYPLTLAVVTGAVASVLAIGLAAMSGSPFVVRLVLIIIWYGYFAG